MKLKICALTFIFNFLAIILFAQDYRYTEDQFTESRIGEDIVYGAAPFLNFPYSIESNTTVGDLIMDIYTPQDDTHTLRPAIIFAHGGGFLLGDRHHDDMVTFCDLLAKKGYVTATIDYRKGFNLLANANMHGVRAVYRALQDGRTAIRYLRANASNYGIDPDKIYFVGSSAGAFIGLHATYMDQVNEKPTEADTTDYINAIIPFFHTAPDLGPFDVGDNVTFNGQPDALVSLWGAVQHTDLITVENDTPILMVHGDADAVVPFDSGSPFSYPLLQDVHGSNLINTKLDQLGLTDKETYFVAGEGHEFYGVTNGNWTNGNEGNAFWDIIFDRIVNFLWLQHKPTADFNNTHNDLEVTFTDSSQSAISWLWDFGDGNTSTLQNPVHTYATTGDYDVTLYIENDNLSWDEITRNITVEEVLSNNDYDYIDFTYYPNPSDDIINFELKDYYPEVDLKWFNVTGQLVLEKKYTNVKNIQLDIRNLANQLYFITLEKNNQLYRCKVVKK